MWIDGVNDVHVDVVPGGLLGGADYQIRLMWGPNHDVGDYSDNFTVVVPTFTVTDPTTAFRPSGSGRGGGAGILAISVSSRSSLIGRILLSWNS